MAANDIQNKKRSKGRQCAAYGYLNFFYNNDGEKSGIHFFKFPDKNPEKQKWCNAIKRQDGKDGFKVSNNTFICQDHFIESDIRKNPNTWRLNKGVESMVITSSSETCDIPCSG